MSTVYVIADTHFGHRKIIEFEREYRSFASIEEHDRAIVERWNAIVRKRDVVWHLGDVYFGKDGHEVLGALNGLKKLVLGNHDYYPLAVYQRYFSKIFGAAQLAGCVLTHVPVHPQQLERRYALNIHGHLHHKALDNPRYVCVSAERTRLTPVTLSKILAIAKSATGEVKLDGA